MRIELFAFEYFDERRKRWVTARYRAEKSEIAARYPQHRLVGEPEIRNVNDDVTKRFPTKPGG